MIVFREKQLEQERLDTELAKRLASEKNSNAQLIETSPTKQATAYVFR